MDYKKWIQDIMQQKFLDSDLTRLIMLNFFVKDDTLKTKYLKYDLLTYIYRTYMDNDSLSSINPSIKVKNIRKFGVTDFKDILDKALFEWDKYASNTTLQYDDLYLYIVIDASDGATIVNNTKKVIKMLNRKYFSITIESPKEITESDIYNDNKNGLFYSGLFKDRVLEDIQYCPLCEETDLTKLCAVHILPMDSCNSSEIIDKNNGILLCEEHAKEYIAGKFKLDDNGYVINNCSSIVNEKMHLNIQVKKSKKYYLKKNYDSK